MIYKIEVSVKSGSRDRHGEHIRHDIADIGIKNAPEVKYSQIYSVDGDISSDDARRIAADLLTDPITETFRVSAEGKESKSSGHNIEVWLKHGVTDTVAESVLKAVNDLGINVPIKVKTGQKFVFSGGMSLSGIKQIAERLLVNPMVQEYKIK